MKLLIVSLVLILSGCSSIKVRLQAESDINRDADDVPQSVAVRVFQLKGISAFNSAQVLPLFDNPDDVLGGDLLSDHEFFMQPGQTQRFRQVILPGAKFIGVVAAFRRSEAIPWRQFVLINSANRYTNERVRIHLSSVGLSVR